MYPVKPMSRIYTETYVACVMRNSGTDVKDNIKKLKQDTETLKQPFLLVLIHHIKSYLVLDHQFLMLPFSLLNSIGIPSSFFAFGVEYTSCLWPIYVLAQLMVGLSLKRGASAGLNSTPSASDML